MAKLKEFKNFMTSLACFVMIVFILLYLAMFFLDYLFNGRVDQVFPLWIILVIILISGVVSVFGTDKLKRKK